MVNIVSKFQVPRTWFQYRGNKQFGPFFGAELDPKCHKEL
jgi:hypothetical protein